MLSPEVRKGIEALLAHMSNMSTVGIADPMVADAAFIAWLKKQLEADDWDKQIERMGGGRKARDAYMKPFFDAKCSVTAFDTHAQLTTDGRERGLWIWLNDESKARAQRYDEWVAGALETFCKLAGLDDKKEKFSMSMAMSEFKTVSNSTVKEAALLEWPDIKAMHAAIGKQIEMHEQVTGAVKARTPRKPDRRAAKRRQADKTKARLKR